MARLMPLTLGLLAFVSIVNMAFISIADAKTKSFILGTKGDLSIVRGGKAMMIPEEDHRNVARRLVRVYSKSDANTSEYWFKSSLLQPGETLEQKWIDLQNETHFSFMPKPLFKDSVVKDTDVKHVILTINESPKDGYFGEMMTQWHNGVLHAYRLPSEQMIKLYCLDSLAPFLPSHYETLREKYTTPDYKAVDIDCTPPKKKIRKRRNTNR